MATSKEYLTFILEQLSGVDGALRARIALQKLRELKENREVDTTILLPVTLVERGSTRGGSPTG